jgi:hypothetical protein
MVNAIRANKELTLRDIMRAFLPFLGPSRALFFLFECGTQMRDSGCREYEVHEGAKSPRGRREHS